MEDGEEEQSELSGGEKSPLVKTFSQSSMRRRKSTRGSSFVGSEKGEKEEKALKDNEENADEVSCGAASLSPHTGSTHQLPFTVDNIIRPSSSCLCST